MKKLGFFVIILTLALVLGLWSRGKDDSMVVVVNHRYFDTVQKRQDIYGCLAGGEGEQQLKGTEITLFTDSTMLEKYRNLKRKLEGWGAKVTLRKGTETTLFDMRAGGSLPLYIWPGSEQELYDCFISENAEFCSTGFTSREYDLAHGAGNREKMHQLAVENICAVWVS